MNYVKPESQNTLQNIDLLSQLIMNNARRAALSSRACYLFSGIEFSTKSQGKEVALHCAGTIMAGRPPSGNAHRRNFLACENDRELCSGCIFPLRKFKERVITVPHTVLEFDYVERALLGIMIGTASQ